MKRAMPDSWLAAYQPDADGSNLVLKDSSPKKNHFLGNISADEFVWDFNPGKRTTPVTQALTAGNQAKLLHKDVRDDALTLLTCPISSASGLLMLLVAGLRSTTAKERTEGQKRLVDTAKLVQSNLLRELDLNDLLHSNSFLTRLVTGSKDIDITAPPSETITTIIKRVKEKLNYDRLTISMRQPESPETLEVLKTAGQAKPAPAGTTFGTAGVFHGEVYRRANGFVVANMQDSKLHGRFQAGDLERSALRSFAGVPIIEAGLPKGTLAVESKDIDHYSEKDLQALSAIAQIYGSALCWADRYQDIHSLATIDGLTELLNSRTFRQRMEEEIERDVRYGSAMTMLMLDIDNFKRVNDSYGHPYGDYVIKQTAQLIRASIRKADVAGRLGGEEFGVVIINSDTGSSRKTAERIRRSISGYKYVNEGIKSRISISIGMSEYPQNGDTIKEIIQHADDAMYHVKHRGGNAVHSYNELFA